MKNFLQCMIVGWFTAWYALHFMQALYLDMNVLIILFYYLMSAMYINWSNNFLTDSGSCWYDWWTIKIRS